MEGAAVRPSKPIAPADAARAAVLAVAAILLFLALAPAWLGTHGDEVAALAIAAFFSKLCHQRPERVLYLFGAPTAVCVRCLGIYAGAVLGSLTGSGRRRGLQLFTAALFANLMDVIAESLSMHGNLPQLRFGMGLLLGLAIGALLISRNDPSAAPVAEYRQTVETTRHGAERLAERGIALSRVRAAVEAAKRSGDVVSKIGKYGTPQTIYTGNGVRVVVEEAGANAGKIVTAFFL